MGAPIASNAGTAFSKTSSRPPTMIVSVPFCAPMSPPETGASRKECPASSSCFPISRVTSGEIVLMSMKSVPAPAPSTAPFSPKRTASTSGESVTIEITMSFPTAHSRGVSAFFAPAATTSSQRDAVRL